MHVIHLVRDPRGVVNSVLKKNDGWIDTFGPAEVCGNIRESLQTVREFSNVSLLEQRYSLVRYAGQTALFPR